jgi:hypothetical protein
MPNRFRPFYTRAYRISGIKLFLRVDLPQFRTLSALCENIHPGFPPLPPNWRELTPQQQSIQVNTCFQGWLDSAPTDLGSNLHPLVDRVTSELMQQFRQDTIDPNICRLWRNYYTNTCYNPVFEIWNTRGNYLPHLKTPEKFYSLLGRSYALYSTDRITEERHNWIESPNWMLRRFNLDNSPVSISALTTWSRATISNGLCSKIRESEDPYFKLFPLGVVTNTKTTYALIEDALNSSDCPEIIRETVRKEYPNPEQEGLKGNISEQIINHLCGSIDEQFNRSQIQVRQFQRARILVQSLKTYLGNSPLAVNQLRESDFAEIGNFYQQRLASLSENESQLTLHWSSSAIELFLKSIGTIVQKYANRLLDPMSIHAIIGGDDSDMTGEDILEDEDLISPIDWVYLQSLQENYSELYEQIDLFCQLPPDTSTHISRQQILWLRYGLKLGMARIGDLINIHFGLSPGPGGAALQLQQARTALVRSIHQGLNSSEPLIREDAIKFVIECLEKHFLLVLHGLFATVVDRLNIEPSMVLLQTNRSQFINLFTAEIEQMSRLNHQNDISQAAIEEIVEKLLRADT